MVQAVNCISPATAYWLDSYVEIIHLKTPPEFKTVYVSEMSSFFVFLFKKQEEMYSCIVISLGK